MTSTTSIATPLSTSSIQLSTTTYSLWIPGIDAANATTETLYASVVTRNLSSTEYILTCQPTPASSSCALFTGQTYTDGASSNVTVEMAGSTYTCREGRSNKPRRSAVCNVQSGTNPATITTVNATQSRAWKTEASVAYTPTPTTSSSSTPGRPTAHICDDGKAVTDQELCSAGTMVRAKYTVGVCAILALSWLL